MIDFKEYNQTGFTFIEMMVALTLLAIFGSSLLVTQADLLTKIFNTHRTAICSNDVPEAQLSLKIKIEQALQQKKSPDTIAISYTKQNPERTITAKTNEINPQSTLYKKFGKRVRILQTTIVQNTYQDDWYTLIYIPEIPAEQPKIPEII